MNASDFCAELARNGIRFFCGVPDSLLKDFCAYLSDNLPDGENIITANEGNATALACGYYLATGEPACVYMQNSGLGNCVNPLLSLADEEVYKIPMLLVIGWRGEPGVKDEPQHVKQGKATVPLLEAMGIENRVLNDVADVNKAVSYIRQTNKPYTLIVRKGTFDKYKLNRVYADCSDFSREDAIAGVVSLIGREALVVSTTGMISRELYEIREKAGSGHQNDFLTVGSMGHSSSIALGIALQKPQRKVYCFDGDGAVLMHMGAAAVVCSLKPENFRHIVFNNAAHDSVGGQPTVCGGIDFVAWARSVGYCFARTVRNEQELRDVFDEFANTGGPAFLEIKVKKGARPDLGRPKEKPQENKALFMNEVKAG